MGTLIAPSSQRGCADEYESSNPEQMFHKIITIVVIVIITITITPSLPITLPPTRPLAFL